MDRFYGFDIDEVSVSEIADKFVKLKEVYPSDTIFAASKSLVDVTYDLDYLKALVKSVNERIAQLEAKEKEEHNG